MIITTKITNELCARARNPLVRRRRPPLLSLRLAFGLFWDREWRRGLYMGWKNGEAEAEMAANAHEPFGRGSASTGHIHRGTARPAGKGNIR